jgi:putative membrane protein
MGAGTAEAATAATAPGWCKPPSAQDVHWMRSNARTDLAEITLGKLALAKSHRPGVRQVAIVTLKDHEAVLAKLRVLAKREHVKLPARPNASQRKDARKLESLSGRKFNLAWDKVEIAGHKLSIKQTRKETAQGSAPPVAHFARRYLPVAKMHLRMAERLHHRLV